MFIDVDSSLEIRSNVTVNPSNHGLLLVGNVFVADLILLAMI